VFKEGREKAIYGTDSVDRDKRTITFWGVAINGDPMARSSKVIAAAPRAASNLADRLQQEADLPAGLATVLVRIEPFGRRLHAGEPTLPGFAAPSASVC
jgi:hypothetical protein